MTGFQHIGSSERLFDQNGRMYQNEFAEYNGKNYYFDENGIMQTGWVSYAGSYYYLYEDGTMATGTVFIDGNEYTFDENGRNISTETGKNTDKATETSIA